MSKGKKYIIQPQGIVVLGAAVILLIALVILLAATNCFGKCPGKESAIQLPNKATEKPTEAPPTQVASTLSPLGTDGINRPVGGIIGGEEETTPPIITDPEETPKAPDGTNVPPTNTPAGTPELKKDPNALKKPTNEMKKRAAHGTLSGNNVNLRQGPSTTTPIVAADLKKGAELTIYKEDGDFYFVKIDAKDIYGYISKRFVKITKDFGEPTNSPKPTKESTADQPSGTVLGTVTASKVALRSNHSTSSKVIAEYYKGKQVYIYYEMNGFYYVKVAGIEKKGYMFADYVHAEGPVGSG